MSILRNSWFLCLAALVTGLLTHAGVLLYHWNVLFGPEPQEEIIELEETPLYWAFHPQEMDRLRLELQQRLHAAAVWETELSAYEARLQGEREELLRLQENILRERRNLEGILLVVEAGEAANLRNLARTYATLTPEATVALFEELSDEAVVKILSFMKADTIGAILQHMTLAAGDEAARRRAALFSERLRLLRRNEEEGIL